MRRTTFVLLIILGLLLAAPAFASPQVFVERTIQDSYDGPSCVYATDVDGDGDNDVLGTAVSADDITWWENVGGAPPSFVEHTIDGDFDGALFVFATDVDGDSDTDVLGAASYAKDITWWENVGGNPPSFVEHTIDGDFDGAYSVYATDVDGDGDTDVLGAGYQARDITWWENIGGTPPSFIEHTIDSDLDGAVHVYAADIDGDNDMDVLGAGHDADDIIWWENLGGSPPDFIEHIIDGDFDGARWVHASDVDGDDDMDVLGTAWIADEITWWENVGGTPPSFVEHTIDGDFDAAFSVYATDVDRDGDTDVLGTAWNADDVSWWENVGGSPPSFIKHTINGDLDGARGVYATDIDGDGDTDVLPVGNYADEITWWENLGSPTIVAAIDIKPNTLNLKSKGRWVTAYIELPQGYDVADIDVGTVLLEDTLPAAPRPTAVGDHDRDGVPDLMVKFSRQDLIAYLKANGLTSGDVELVVTGHVDSVPFEGTDSIRVR